MGLIYGTAHQVLPARPRTPSGMTPPGGMPVRAHALAMIDGVVPDEAMCGWHVAKDLASPDLDWFSIERSSCCHDCATAMGVASGVET